MQQTVDKRADFGAWVSIIAYILLSIIKLGVGYIANSDALKADGINNVTDILASVAVLIGLNISRKPRDLDHPYGHSRAEHISSLIASFIMMSVGLQVIWNAALKIFENKPEAPDLISAWAGAGCAIVMFGVYAFNSRLAKKVNSSALNAAAKDNLSDAFVSIGTVVGIIGAQFSLAWLDPLAAVIVGIIICKTAWEIFLDATNTLIDGYDPDKVSVYKESIEKVKGVVSIKELRARSHGTYTLVEVTILVNPELGIVESHEIADNIEIALKDKFGIFCHVHVEPHS
jgi:cation diffusion facilitator family transporter